MAKSNLAYEDMGMGIERLYYERQESRSKAYKEKGDTCHRKGTSSSQKKRKIERSSAAFERALRNQDWDSIY